MRRVIFKLCLALLAVISAQGGAFEDANKAYEQGRYADAISLYQTLLKSGHHSPGVIFNLGNAFFKNGEIGRAIYQYRRAQRIAPRDPDVQANLRFARDRVAGSVSVQPSAAERLLGYFTLNELAAAATFFFWVWIGLLCFVRYKPASRAGLRPYVAGCAVLFILTEATLLLAYHDARQPVAIVALRQVTVRLGPLEESQAAFTASDGTELEVLARREEWLQVADRSGRTGWLNARQALLFSGV